MKVIWDVFSTLVYWTFLGIVLVLVLTFTASMSRNTGYSVTDEGIAKIPEKMSYLWNMDEEEVKARMEQVKKEDEERRFQEWDSYHREMESRGIFHRKGWNTSEWNRSNWNQWNK